MSSWIGSSVRFLWSFFGDSQKAEKLVENTWPTFKKKMLRILLVNLTWLIPGGGIALYGDLTGYDWNGDKYALEKLLGLLGSIGAFIFLFSIWSGIRGHLPGGDSKEKL